MHRYPVAKTAIALACVALSSGAIGASSFEAPVVISTRQCVNIQASSNFSFGVPSARGVSGGGTVIEAVQEAQGTDPFTSSQSRGRVRLEPVSLSFSGSAELRNMGLIVNNLFIGKDPRLAFVDIASLDREFKVLWSQRFVQPFLTGFSSPELSRDLPGPANFGVEFVAEQKGAGTGCGTQKGNDLIIDKSRFVVEAGGLDSNAVRGVGAIKITVPVIATSSGLDVRSQPLAPGRPNPLPVDLFLNPMYAGTWANWFQQATQGKPTRKDVTIRLLDIKGQPVASIVLYDAWPSRLAPLYGDGVPERVGMTLQYSRAEIR